MIGVVDTETQEPRLVSEQEAMQGITAGKFVVPNNQLFQLKDLDGNFTNPVAGANLASALLDGKVLASPEEAEAARSARAESPLTTGLKHFGNEALFGIPKALIKSGESPEEAKQTELNYQAAGKANKLAAGAGNIAGFAGQMALPLGEIGEAGKGVEALVKGGSEGALRGIAARGAGLATEGAAYGALGAAPDVIDETSIGDYKGAAESLLTHAGLGALLNVGIGVPVGIAGKAGETLMRRVGGARTLEELKQEMAIRSLVGGTDDGSNKLIAKLGHGDVEAGRKEFFNAMEEHGMVPKPGQLPIERLDNISAKKNEIGQAIGNARELLDAHDTQGIGIGSILEQLDNKLLPELEKNPFKATQLRNIKQTLEDFKSSAVKVAEDNELNGVFGPLMQQGKELVEKGQLAPEHLEDLKAMNYRLTTGQLWNLRRQLDEKIFQEGRGAFFGQPNPLDKELTKFRGSMDDIMDTHNEEIAKKSGKEDIIPTLMKANKDYKNLSVMEDVAERAYQKSVKNNQFSLTDWIAGGAGASALGALAHPLSALGGVAALVSKKYLRENGPQLVYKYADKLGPLLGNRAEEEMDKKLSLIPQMLKNWKANEAPLTKLKRGTVTNFSDLLSQLNQPVSKDPATNYQNFADLVSSSVGDPNVPLGRLAQETQNGAPQFTNAIVNTAHNAQQWLAEQLPKPLTPPVPFSKPWQPSPQQIKDFADKWEIANNPNSIMEKLVDGTINQNHMDTLQKLFPTTYAAIKAKIMESAYDPKVKMEYNQKLLLSKLLGVNLDPSIGYTQDYQASYAPPAKGGNGGAKPNKRSSPLGNLPGSEPTQMQRIEQR